MRHSERTQIWASFDLGPPSTASFDYLLRECTDSIDEYERFPPVGMFSKIGL